MNDATSQRRRHRDRGVKVDGAAIRKLRKERGYSGIRLAPLVPMSSGFLSQLECGRKHTISPEKFIRLAELLGGPDLIRAEAA